MFGVMEKVIDDSFCWLQFSEIILHILPVTDGGQRRRCNVFEWTFEGGHRS